MNHKHCPETVKPLCCARTVMVFVATLLLVFPLLAAHPQQGLQKPTALEIMQRYYAAYFAAGKDARIEAKLELIDKSGARRTRRFTVWRVNLKPDGSEQKMLLYFHEPADVRGLSIMVWKYPGRDDDRWMFIPAINLVRRLSARDYSQSFVGSDFTYEDGLGRDVSQDEHRLLREEELEGMACYVVETTAKTKASWTKQILWIDQQMFLPRKREYYNVQGQLDRTFTGGETKTIAAGSNGETFATMMQHKMENMLNGHSSVMTFLSVEYNVGLKAGDFTERHLRRPPRQWLK